MEQNFHYPSADLHPSEVKPLTPQLAPITKVPQFKKTEEFTSWFQFIHSNFSDIEAIVVAVVAIVTPITTIAALLRRTKKRGRVK